MTAFVGNTNVVEIIGLRDRIAGIYIDDATVTVTVKTAAGANVSGETWPKAMTYQGGDGHYAASLDDGLALTAGGVFYAHISVTSGSLVGSWQYRFRPRYRL
jgi:hypothetical protein